MPNDFSKKYDDSIKLFAYRTEPLIIAAATPYDTLYAYQEVKEINKIASPIPNTGLNFGWRCYEGSSIFSTSGTCPTYATTVAPFAQYPHAIPANCYSITGGYFYTGTTYPNFQNKYFFADYCSNKIGTANNAGVITWTGALAGSFTTFGEDKDGELYIANSSTIYKIIDSSLEIDSFSKNGLSIFPNPSKNEFTINNANQLTLTKAKLFDLSGKLLLTQNIENTNSINISNLSSGLYLVSVEDTLGNQYQTKLVKE